MNELKIFNNERFGEVRTSIINGEPYFIGKYYKVISGYEIEYFTDDINEQ